MVGQGLTLAPNVSSGISGFDIDLQDAARLSVGAEAISLTGFRLVVRTWRQTKVYRVEIGWLALGSG
jgi:hypothetical protein